MSLASLADAPQSEESLRQHMVDMGTQARAASRQLARVPNEQKNQALRAMAASLRARIDDVLEANESDLSQAREDGLSPALIDRLALDPARLEAIARSIDEIADLPDPVGETMASWDRPNGLKISRVRVPLGVIGIIYESRPNVTADAGALCLKSGNAVILRGGKESFFSSHAIHAALQAGLQEAGLPTTAIQLVPVKDRAAVGLMLKEMTEYIDVIIPRGGKGLIARVQADARLPVMGHLQGLCHIYVDRAADLEMAKQVLVNSKMRRTGICGASETLLVDAACADEFVPELVEELVVSGCEVRGDEASQALDARVLRATEDDWLTEYLDAIIAMRIVDGVEGAIAHIDAYSSHHTESIITADPAAAERFLNAVDSAIVMHNASTQFADGGEFGMGAEIGIATGKLHARGPVGAEQLTSFKYVVHGQGHTRA